MPQAHLFLSAAELEQLTGYRQHKRQIAVLRTLRIPFYEVDGRPVVTRAAVEGREKAEPREPFDFGRVA